MRGFKTMRTLNATRKTDSKIKYHIVNYSLDKFEIRDNYTHIDFIDMIHECTKSNTYEFKKH